MKMLYLMMVVMKIMMMMMMIIEIMNKFYIVIILYLLLQIACFKLGTICNLLFLYNLNDIIYQITVTLQFDRLSSNYS